MWLAQRRTRGNSLSHPGHTRTILILGHWPSVPGAATALDLAARFSFFILNTSRSAMLDMACFIYEKGLFTRAPTEGAHNGTSTAVKCSCPVNPPLSLHFDSIANV